MSYWKEVDALLDKGKGGKPVKVTAAELNDYRDEFEILQQKFREGQEKYAQVAGKSENIKSLFAKYKENSTAEIEGLTAQLAEKDETIGALTADIERFKKDAADAGEVADAKHERIKKIEAECEEKIKEKDNILFTKIAEKNKEIKEKEKFIEDLNGQIQQAAQQINQFQEGIQQLQGEVAKRDAQIATFSADVNAAQKLADEKKAEIVAIEQTLNAKKAEMEASMVKMQEEQKAAQMEINKAKLAAGDIVAAKDHEINQLKQQLMNLQSNAVSPQVLAQKDQQIAQLNQALTNLQGQGAANAGALQAENQTLRGDMNNMQQALNAAKNQINQMQMAIQQKDKKIAELGQPQSVMAPQITQQPIGQPMAQPMGQPMGQPAAQPMGQPAAQPMGIYRSGNRNMCPQCGSSKIKEVTDKTKVVSYVPRPIYAKKRVCSQCGYEF